jgi:hypothetical protein
MQTWKKRFKDCIYVYKAMAAYRPKYVINCVSWDITPCSAVRVNWHFERTYRHHLQCWRLSHVINIHFMLRLLVDPEDGRCAWETYCTWPYIKEDILVSLRSNRSEDLISYISDLIMVFLHIIFSCLAPMAHESCTPAPPPKKKKKKRIHF